MIKIIISLLFTISIASASNGGRTVGNGGDVLKCQDVSLNNERYIILDWYEGKVIRGLKLELGGEELSLSDKIQMALNRLQHLSPDRALRYQRHLETFFTEVKWLTDGVLINIPDSDHIAIPKDCIVLQIANQSSPILSTDKRYIIDQNLWNRLNKDQQVALLLHEIIYREAIELGQINSVSTRILNSLILSLDIEKLSVPEFTNILKELGFKENRVQGVSIDLNQYDFFENGILKTAKVIPGSNFVYNADTFKLRDQVNFFEDGSVQNFTPIQNSTINYKGHSFSILPFPVSFFQNGNLESLMLDKGNILGNEHYELKIEGVTKFYDNGNLKIANIQSGKVFLTQTEPNTLNVKNIVSFYPNANLSQTIIDEPYKLSILNTHLKIWIGPLQLDQFERVKAASLLEALDVNIQGKKILLAPFYLIQFWPETGKIKSAKIQNSAILVSQKNQSISLYPNAVINLDANGKLIY